MPSCINGSCGLGPSECQCCSEAQEQRRKGPADQRCRVKTTFTVAPPREGTNERRGLNCWLNRQHCGTDLPPDQISKEHENAAWAMCRHQGGELTVELQKDGSYRAINLSFGGERFDLVPNTKKGRKR